MPGADADRRCEEWPKDNGWHHQRGIWDAAARWLAFCRCPTAVCTANSANARHDIMPALCDQHSLMSVALCAQEVIMAPTGSRRPPSCDRPVRLIVLAAAAPQVPCDRDRHARVHHGRHAQACTRQPARPARSPERQADDLDGGAPRRIDSGTSSGGEAASGRRAGEASLRCASRLHAHTCARGRPCARLVARASS